MPDKKQANEKQVQEMYLQMQLLESQIKEIEQELENIEARKVDIINLQDSLKNFDKIKKGTPSYSPLGLGVYTKSKMEDTSKVLVNVGASIIVEKNTKEAVTLMKDNVKQADQLLQQLNANLQLMTMQHGALQEQLQSLM